MTEPTQISRELTVDIRYRLTDAETGKELDSNAAGEPLSYVHGHGQILPGLEKALEQRTVGEELAIAVPAEEGYGPYHDELVMQVPRSQFGFDVAAGKVVQAQMPDGRSHYLLVTEVSDNEVTLDGNHPLAGRALHFDVKVEGVREATTEELEKARA